LLAELGDRTDLDRVMIHCGNDIVLVEQNNVPGYFDWDFFVEVTGTLGVPVRVVFEQYAGIRHAIIPDNAVIVPWSAISGREGPIYLSESSNAPLWQWRTSKQWLDRDC
jgi:hypothetical protein